MARRSSSAPASRGEHPAERPRKDVESPRGHARSRLTVPLHGRVRAA